MDATIDNGGAFHVTDQPCEGPLFNKLLGSEGVKLLAILYRLDGLRVARLCDEHLDRSGALLGDVRTCARKAVTAQKPDTPIRTTISHADEANDTLIPVVLTASRWKRIAACIDWHGKDHESELIVDAIRGQTGDEQF